MATCHNPIGRPWTPSDVLRLCRLAGWLNIDELCEVLDRSRSAINNRANKLKITTLKRCTARVRRHAVQSVINGESVEFVSDRLGISKEVIRLWLEYDAATIQPSYQPQRVLLEPATSPAQVAIYQFLGWKPEGVMVD